MKKTIGIIVPCYNSENTIKQCIDRYLSRVYGECIKEYEKNNGIAIKNVCFYQDAVKTKYIRNSG